ncbi:MAG TPA: hypothetical protein VF736_13815 [Pyrinomonadaceae bacterium]
MKYLIFPLFFAVAAFLLYWRLRPYIRGLRRFLGVLRDVRGMQAGAPQSDLPRRPERRAAAEKLLRCASCGNWTPASRAVSLRGGTTYCSHACLERAADPTRKARKSAS